ncbi:EamA family transporter RarD [Spirochaetota bacterium]
MNNTMQKHETKGLFFGIMAYSLWGLLPVFWKQLDSVNALEILAHRISWSFVMLLLLNIFSGKKSILLTVLKNKKKLLTTILAGFFISANWGIYIWAMVSEKIVESGIGYYLNPIMTVALGGLVLKEKLDKGVYLSILIAAIGLFIMTISYGHIPWVSFLLALSFAMYGLVKKLADVDAIVSLLIETAFLLPFALAFLLYIRLKGNYAFGSSGLYITTMLMLTGLATSIPMLLFSEGVKRLKLSIMGFLQYISPSIQIILGLLVYKESMDRIGAIAFAFTIAAVIVFTLTRSYNKNP